MVALITGGSSGIGLEYSRQLAARGYELVLVSNREQELADAAQTLSAVAAVRTRCQDLAGERSADGLFAWCQAEGLHPDVLVNNAGMFFFKELQVEDLDRVQAMINLHVTTVTRLCVLFGQDMKARGGGYILNVSSMASRIPVPGITVYSATKAYLRNFGRSFSYEMRPYGVSVTTVCPAAVATPLYRLSEKKMRTALRVGLVQTPAWLVRRSLRAMFRKRRIISPAFMNVWLPALIALLPAPLVARIWIKVK
ncbi:MAG: SDR family NAD(P)-dependent oxidoreductase [Bacteroidales bacterium]|jgi:short-subunit dehydrogenase|nr:SDR family NAD(P)-dependent oxidoreductase [Bacteroidales bacterium]